MDSSLILAQPGALVQRVAGLSTVPFENGDCSGEENRNWAVQNAISEKGLCEEGSVRKKLYAVQESLINFPEVNCPLQHVFAPGACARTIYIPAGCMIIGRIHLHKHLNILSMGTALVATEYDGAIRLTGPLTMVSEPGTKRAVYAETDLVWTTIHLTNETDVDKMVDEISVVTYEEYEQFVRGERK